MKKTKSSKKIVLKITMSMTCNGIAAPWGMGCAMVLPPHGSWVAQWYGVPMGHGLHNGMKFPCPMGYMMVQILCQGY